jgi:cell division septation protein DedD
VQIAEAAPPVAPVPQTAPVKAPKLAAASRPTSRRKESIEAFAKTPTMPHADKARPNAELRQASARRGDSKAVVQLGAYSNPKSVLAAWNAVSHRFGALHGYSPMSARFASPRGTFYRLSVHGFGSVNEAIALCSSLRRSGGSCFVRNVAGDAPVQIAMR